MRVTDNGGCFACGPNNPIGLHLHFRTEGDAYHTEFVPTEHHQGYAGIVHGGILATLLDEVMARFCWVSGVPAMTAEMRVSLLKPAFVGQRLTATGRITRRHHRLLLCEASLRRDDGTIVATAEGKFLRVPHEPAPVTPPTE
ncbi:MAG: PaaI family thioesterase [Armatimonadetes bacterium]|nr:PaaI family thioesterase [Armatimonadota bacterium]